MKASGSSTGSAVATTLGLTFAALGTEADGSICNPAGKASLVGLKPTTGLVSRDGVIPASNRLDTVGLFTRRVRDSAAILSVIAGKSDRDSRTQDIPFDTIPNYVAACSSTDLGGIRIGIPRQSIGSVEPAETEAFEKAIQELKSAGAEIVDDVKLTAADEWESYSSHDRMSVTIADLAESLEKYFATLETNPNGLHSLKDLIDYTRNTPEEDFAHYNTATFEMALDHDHYASDKFAKLDKLREFITAGGGLGAALNRENLDVLVVPTAASTPVTFASLEGSPLITVPLGFHGPDTPVVKEKKGDLYNTNYVFLFALYSFPICFLGRRFAEEKLLQIAYAFELIHNPGKGEMYKLPESDLKTTIGRIPNQGASTSSRSDSPSPLLFELFAGLDELREALSDRVTETSDAQLAYCSRHLRHLLSSSQFQRRLFVDTPDRTEPYTTELSAIANVAKTISQHVHSTFGEVVGTMRSNGGLPQNESGDPRFNAEAIQLIFLFVGWITCLYNPIVDGLPDRLTVKQESKSLFEQPQQPLDGKKHLSLFIHDFGMVLFKKVHGPDLSTLSSSDDVIQVSILNAAHLRQVRKLRIEWTRSIGTHLELDTSANCLKLFCLTSIPHLQFRNPSSPLCQFISTFYDDHTRPDGFTTQGLVDEIMLSYEIIFQNNSGAKKVYRKQRKTIRKQHGEDIDPLLDEQCGFSLSSRNSNAVDKSKNRQQTFRKVEFPILGDRLMELQAFARQEPANKFWRIIRDKSDTKEWYQFIVVVIFGSVALLLAVTNTGLAIAQLVFAIKTYNLEKSGSNNRYAAACSHILSPPKIQSEDQLNPEPSSVPVKMVDEFMLYTSVRYDPALLEVPDHPEYAYAGWNFENRSAIYMLDFHRDRMARAAENWGWGQAIEAVTGEAGLRRLEADIEEEVARRSPGAGGAVRLRVHLTKAGQLRYTVLDTLPGPLERLLPMKLPVPGHHSSTAGSGLPPKTPGLAVRLDPSTTSSSMWTHFKTTFRRMYDAARERCHIREGEDAEVLLVSDVDGSVMEASRATPYFYRDGRWVTPPVWAQPSTTAGSGGQDGTTRRWALDRGLAVKRPSLRVL
ncbi:uncharacterized protein E0L32_006680 [Thyridium curvatum]|uniref:Amidase domain-containing protein n=1 Tax=Thyridium curvatum TaxID=1093900 RepID=A0A507B837_9PEZI|nr:uncharacterized protein E0L32_006680 [Thyridium curvatum]TPX12800.1 hypothetical protein E0L32_006680 [Thyridium curvatum]